MYNAPSAELRTRRMCDEGGDRTDRIFPMSIRQWVMSLHSSSAPPPEARRLDRNGRIFAKRSRARRSASRRDGAETEPCFPAEIRGSLNLHAFTRCRDRFGNRRRRCAPRRAAPDKRDLEAPSDASPSARSASFAVHHDLTTAGRRIASRHTADRLVLETSSFRISAHWHLVRRLGRKRRCASQGARISAPFDHLCGGDRAGAVTMLGLRTCRRPSGSSGYVTRGRETLRSNCR